MTDRNSGSGPYCICHSFDDTRFMICCDHCNKWFHGDCVNVKSDEAKKITHFYCPPCQEDNPALKIVYRSMPSSPGSASPRPTVGFPGSASAPALLSKGNDMANGAVASAVGDKRPNPGGSTPTSADSCAKHPKITSETSFKCGNCIGCFRKENCGRCDVCKQENPGDQTCLLRRCVNADSAPAVTEKGQFSESDEDDLYIDRKKKTMTTPRTNAKLKNVGSRKDGSGERRVGRPPKHKSGNNSPSAASTPGSGGTRASARAYRNFLKDAGVLPNSDDEGGNVSTKARQCYGTGCIYAARPQSKYCSDECGLKLARQRIEHLLPSRFQQFYTRRPVAEEFEQRRLVRIRSDHATGQARLGQLENEERELNAWREKCKTVRLKENEGGKSAKSKVKEVESDDPETSVYCVTCGNETSMKNAIKHFAKCFSKYESQTSYGSSFKAINNLYNIFCDTYNKANRTYCKRLRVICPEHSKEDKVDAHEICGCPSNPEKRMKTAEFDVAMVCTTLKKNCTKHYHWMTIRRALIDMERLTQLLRLEELAEESRCIQMAQNSRGNLLALLLHQTITHDEPQPIIEDPRQYEDRDGENQDDKTAMDTDQKDESITKTDRIDHLRKLDVVPKYPNQETTQKLEDGWQGVYGD